MNGPGARFARRGSLLEVVQRCGGIGQVPGLASLTRCLQGDLDGELRALQGLRQHAAQRQQGLCQLVPAAST